MKERFIKKNQRLFDQIIDAGEALANNWIRSSHLSQTSSDLSLQSSPLWQSFLSSTYYLYYNQLFAQLASGYVPLPKVAFNNLRGAIRFNGDQAVFDRESLITIINEEVNKDMRKLACANDSQSLLAFKYKPTDDSPGHDNLDEAVEIYSPSLAEASGSSTSVFSAGQEGSHSHEPAEASWFTASSTSVFSVEQEGSHSHRPAEASRVTGSFTNVFSAGQEGSHSHGSAEASRVTGSFTSVFSGGQEESHSHRPAEASGVTGSFTSETPTAQDKTSSNSCGFGWQVLGLVIGVLGVAAVATAFVFLSAATGGVGGIVLASVGGAAILAGIGLFAFGNKQQGSNSTEYEYKSLGEGYSS